MSLKIIVSFFLSTVVALKTLQRPPKVRTSLDISASFEASRVVSLKEYLKRDRGRHAALLQTSSTPGAAETSSVSETAEPSASGTPGAVTHSSVTEVGSHSTSATPGTPESSSVTELGSHSTFMSATSGAHGSSGGESHWYPGASGSASSDGINGTNGNTSAGAASPNAPGPEVMQFYSSAPDTENNEEVLVLGGFQPVDLSNDGLQLYRSKYVAEHTLEDLNHLREHANETALSVKDTILNYAWEQPFSSGVRYALCLRVILEEEQRYVRIGALHDNVTVSGGAVTERVALTSVSNPVLFLGSPIIVEETSELGHLHLAPGEPDTWASLLPCDAAHAASRIVAGEGSVQLTSSKSGGGALVEKSRTNPGGWYGKVERSEKPGKRSPKHKRKRSLGGWMLSPAEGIAALRGVSSGHKSHKNAIPGAFDAHTTYANCQSPIENQGSCGSCYAFAVNAAASERGCIAQVKAAGSTSTANTTFLAQKRTITLEALSQQDLVSCGSSSNPIFQMPFCLHTHDADGKLAALSRYTGGCDGAPLLSSLAYLHDHGLPTKECVPYSAGGATNVANHMEVDSSAGVVATCASLAAQHSCQAVERSVHKFSFPLRCPVADVSCMERAIFEGGAIVAGINVFDTFFTYHEESASHIYGTDKIWTYDPTVATNENNGGHAVSLFGWGKGHLKNGDEADYWLGQNSWGSTWGLGGKFRVWKGHNHANIEADSYYMHADANFIDPSRSGSCVKILADSPLGTCRFNNTCGSDVRQAYITFLPASPSIQPSPSQCGSFVVQSEITPGAVHSFSGLHCAVISDQVAFHFVPVHTGTNFEDKTKALNAAWGTNYECLIEVKTNTKRLRCSTSNGHLTVGPVEPAIYSFGHFAMAHFCRHDGLDAGTLSRCDSVYEVDV